MGLFDLFSDANEKKARDIQVAGYKTGEQRASDALGTGMEGLRTNYAGALDEFSPYAASGTAASGLYSDALGLGGADGNARAVGAFQAGPGYEFALNQGLDAMDRRAASQGRLAGGGHSLDTLSYAQGMGNQEYNSWLDRLMGQQQMGVNVAGQRAGIRTGQGAAEYGYGADLGNLYNQSELGQAGAKAGFEAGKDQTGANIVGTVFGGLSLGAKMLGLGGFAPG